MSISFLPFAKKRVIIGPYHQKGWQEKLKREDLLSLFDREQRIDIDYPDTRKERRPHLIRYVSETGGPHFILYSDLRGADVDAVIAEEQAYFGPLGEVEWKVYAHDTPADLRQRLVAHGFQVDEEETVLVLDLHDGARRATAPRQPREVDVRRLQTVAQLADVRRIEETVWEEDFGWLEERLGDDMAMSDDYIGVYVAYVEEQPACAGWIYFHPHSQFATLYGGSTLPEQRRRGLYTAILDARLQEAAARGYRFVTTDASPSSRPILERAGFEPLTTTWPCVWSANF